jgi:hypothetical protein
MNIRAAIKEYIVFSVAANNPPDTDALYLLSDFVGSFDVCYMSKQTINEWIGSQYVRSSRRGIQNVDLIIHNFLEVKKFVYYLYFQGLVDSFPYKHLDRKTDADAMSVENWKRLSAPSYIGRA